MQLSQKRKTYSQIFPPYLKSKLNFEHFESKEDPQRFCILEVKDAKNLVRLKSKKSRFRGCFDKQDSKRDQALLKSLSQHLYHIHRLLASKLSWKKFLLLTCQILWLPVNTLAAAEKYHVLNRENLTIPIQMQLSQHQNTFFLHFWNLD